MVLSVSALRMAGRGEPDPGVDEQDKAYIWAFGPLEDYPCRNITLVDAVDRRAMHPTLHAVV